MVMDPIISVVDLLLVLYKADWYDDTYDIYDMYDI